MIVVANGCGDDTAVVARGFGERFARAGHRLLVVELGVGSKDRALNAGDVAADDEFPRIYLDADVGLSPGAVDRTLDALSETDEPRLAAPRIFIAPCPTFGVRQYRRLWGQLPYIRGGVPGVGLYAVNRAGRARWGEFPEGLGCDDKYVRLHFDRDEVVVVEDASFTVYLPRRLRELVRVRGRWTATNRELQYRYSGLCERDDPRWRTSAAYVVTTPKTWLDAPVFLGIWAASWALSLRPRRGRWARAESTDARIAA